MGGDVVIIGGGQAALACAVRLRESGHDGEIIIVGEEPWLPYQRPPLSKAFLLGKMTIDRLSFRPQEFFERLRIVVRAGQRVVRIDRARHEVGLSGGDRHRYGKLVIATGSRARTLPQSLTQGLAGILTLRSIEDAELVRQALVDAGRVLVIGAGYIGLEVAAIGAGMGRQVTVIEIADRILNRVACAETARAVSDLHASHGVKLRLRVGIDRFSASGGRVTGALLTDGTEIPADLVIVGIGGTANDELAAESGLEVRNGIIVDRHCRTSDPSILAAGDCAVFPFEDRLVRLESVQNAIDQGSAAAEVIAGKPTEYKPVPWFWSDQYDAKLQSAGLPLNYDQVISLRSARANGSAFWYLRSGNAVAVDTINDARTHMAARRLFGSTAKLSAELLLNPQFDFIQHVRTALPAAS
jgi:3-phenylpropionate/trans-cinnamate dioxygenase ferredoxin reductase component